jgi:uncharacterized membrane protein
MKDWSIFLKRLKPFLIIILINPFLSWIFDLVLGREHQIWRYILSGPLVGILFVTILYFYICLFYFCKLDRNKSMKTSLRIIIHSSLNLCIL